MPDTQLPTTPQPNPALKRLGPLVGTWKLTGRTLGSHADNIHGTMTCEWLPGGFFLVQRGEIEMSEPAFKVHSLEIIGYDPATDTFPSRVYSSLGEQAAEYAWDVRGSVVTHWTRGSKYTGTLSADRRVLSGGWRADGEPENPGNTYDATMIRIS